MALPDNILVKHGTPIIFGEAGASGVTHTLSFDGLADGSAIMSAVADLGENFADEYLVLLMVETGTAPASGKTAELYLVATYSTSYYPGGVTGSAGAWPSDGNEDEWAKQLGAPVVSLVATNDGTVLQTQAPVIWRPPGRYVVAVFDNNLGYAVRDEATATNNDSRVIIVPRQLVITD
jgi:hypothetical protein